MNPGSALNMAGPENICRMGEAFAEKQMPFPVADANHRKMDEDEMKVCWFSCGVSSFLACYLAKDVDACLYTHVADQHPDSLRYLNDCEKVLGREIGILKSSLYGGVDDVIEKTGCINTPYGAACTHWLKVQVRKEWERKNFEHHTYVWGFDVTEKHRAERICRLMSDYDHEFPLIDHGLTKSQCHGWAYSLGIRRPVTYDMGYRNNNCIGCVKGGQGYWNKIRIDYPDVFERRAMQERKIGMSCINGIFLDELEPGSGKMEVEIMEECGIACYLRSGTAV